MPDNERPLKFYKIRKEIYLVTEKALYKIQDKKIAKLWVSPATIIESVENDTCFWMASIQGLILLNKKNYTHTYLEIPALIKRPVITSVLKDESNNIWVGCEAFGFFKFEKNQLVHKYNVFPIISAAYTKDS